MQDPQRGRRRLQIGPGVSQLSLESRRRGHWAAEDAAINRTGDSGKAEMMVEADEQWARGGQGIDVDLKPVACRPEEWFQSKRGASVWRPARSGGEGREGRSKQAGRPCSSWADDEERRGWGARVCGWDPPLSLGTGCVLTGEQCGCSCAAMILVRQCLFLSCCLLFCRLC